MTYLLWLFYILGGVGSLWKRASLSAQSTYTPWQTVREFLKLHASQEFLNFVFSTALFWTMWHDTTSLTQLLHAIGVQKDVAVPLNPLTSVIFGVFSYQLADLLITKVTNVLRATGVIS